MTEKADTQPNCPPEGPSIPGLPLPPGLPRREMVLTFQATEDDAWAFQHWLLSRFRAPNNGLSTRKTLWLETVVLRWVRP